MTQEKQTQANEKLEVSKVMKLIYDNYNYTNARMVEELELSSEHGTLTGGFREGMWLSFFRSIIPVKYQLAQGVLIIDSGGKVSKEVDIAVYDETYTPYVFQYNTLKFIPIEAVAMVIECKSRSYKPDSLKEWSKAIQTLKPKGSGIARIMTGYAVGETNRSQTKTRPIRVLVSLKTTTEDKAELKSIQELNDSFDFILEQQAASESKRLVLHVPNEKRTLGWWAMELNHDSNKLHEDTPMKLQQLDEAFSTIEEREKVEQNPILSDEEKQQKLKELDVKIEQKRIEQYERLRDKYPELNFNSQMELENKLCHLRVKDNPLLSLNLQLNQLLMLLNNPMLFPHFAYAAEFNKIAGTGESKGAEES